MKIWSFIKWHARKMTLDMALWMIFCASLSIWANSQNKTFFYISAVIFVYAFCRILWDLIKRSYNNFEKEQQSLFETIKSSDR